MCAEAVHALSSQALVHFPGINIEQAGSRDGKSPGMPTKESRKVRRRRACSVSPPSKSHYKDVAQGKGEFRLERHLHSISYGCFIA